MKKSRFRKVSSFIKDAQYSIEHEEEIIKQKINQLHELNNKENHNNSGRSKIENN